MRELRLRMADIRFYMSITKRRVIYCQIAISQRSKFIAIFRPIWFGLSIR